eukprot:Transcript_813.p1 GENE.Transcript_813~~Transcript_813.p1  ORF type:complete len:335 (-),score=115.65 Transcript_813:894-1841(-)
MVASTARTAATLGALIYNQVYSLALVLFHAIRVFLSPRSSPTASCEFYEGRVVHVRRKPLKHRFEYAVRYCLVDLDSAEPPPACCASQLADRLTAAEARALTGCTGRVKLLMLPASAGYAQNPICVYYCYADEGGGGEARLQCCVAQVDNTPWGDRVTFAFAPGGDSLPKPMHVSPLQDMRSSWSLRAPAPGASLEVHVGCEHPEMGHFFDAMLQATRLPPEQAAAVSRRSEVWSWLMPHKVAVWIYWHAAVLMWRGLPFLSHPKAHGELEASKADVTERAAKAGRSTCPAAVGAARQGTCPYTWRDATSYPWDG